MNRRFALPLVAGLCLVAALPALAQTDPPPTDTGTSEVVVTPPPPKTHLQAMAEQKSVLIVGGYTDVGTVQNEAGSSVRITVAQLTNSQTSAKETGLLVFLHQVVDGGSRETKSYIDGDEVDSLLSSLDAMSKLDRTTTTLDDFQARYRTRGDLEITSLDDAGVRIVSLHGVEISSSSGQESWATTRFPLARLAQVQQCLTTAKQLIDRTKENK
jgi:hypothetical protein